MTFPEILFFVLKYLSTKTPLLAKYGGNIMYISNQFKYYLKKNINKVLHDMLVQHDKKNNNTTGAN